MSKQSCAVWVALNSGSHVEGKRNFETKHVNLKISARKRQRDIVYDRMYIRRDFDSNDSSDHDDNSDKNIVTVYSTPRLDSSSSFQVPRTSIHMANSDAYSLKTTDMTSLAHLDLPNILNCLDIRYANQRIYTCVADILIAVNPYQTLSIYSDTHMKQYSSNESSNKVAPHIFSITQQAVSHLQRKNICQSLLCCGESGSGKTESARYIMKYLSFLSKNQHKRQSCDNKNKNHNIADQVLRSNIILEALGNAQTLMNNNSSRFAKFIKLMVSGSGQHDYKDNFELNIVGAQIETYLLERCRISNPPRGERNYHIFYYLAHMGICHKTMHFPPAGTKYFKMLGDKAIKSDVRSAQTFVRVATEFGLSPTIQTQIACVLCGILHLGNIQFGGDCDKSLITAKSRVNLNHASAVLNINSDILEKRLLYRNIRIRSEVVEKPYSQHQAVINRNSICKLIYNKLFQYVVDQLNIKLCGQYDNNSNDKDKWIGILDVFGFEQFDHNSFEQFCINYANECLQNIFNDQILISEQREYKKQGIVWRPLNIKDNTQCINLFKEKFNGLFSLLDSCCKLANNTAQHYYDNVFTMHASHQHLHRPSSSSLLTRNIRSNDNRNLRVHSYHFQISHYAGRVQYCIDDFLTKNNDSMSIDNINMCADSKNSLLITLFKNVCENSQSTQHNKKSSLQYQRFKSVGKIFNQQLTKLICTLKQSKARYIRCINPNNQKKPKIFQWSYVNPQIKNGGLVEAVRMLKYGFPYRVPFSEMICGIKSKLYKSSCSNSLDRSILEAILLYNNVDKTQYEIGITKIFFKTYVASLPLQKLHQQDQSQYDPNLLSFVKKWINKRRWNRACRVVQTCVRVQTKIRRLRAVQFLRRTTRIACIIQRTFFRHLRLIRQHAYDNENYLDEKTNSLLSSSSSSPSSQDDSLPPTCTDFNNNITSQMIQQITLEKQQAEAKIKNMTESIEKMNQERSHALNKLQHLRCEKEEIENKLQEKEHQLDDLTQNLSTIKRAHSKKLNQLSAEYTQLKVREQELQAEFQDAAGTLEKMRHEWHIREKELTDWKTQCVAKEIALEELKTENLQLTEKIVLMEQKQDNFKSHLRNLFLNERQQMEQLYQSQLENASSIIAQQQKTISDLQRQLNHFKYK